MAYDAQRGRAVLFGGLGASGALGDTWEWDGSTWTQVASTGPVPRHGHTMAYDARRQRTVLFGGEAQGPSGTQVFDDTWEWDGSSWSRVPIAGPLGRRGAAMVYDAQSEACLLFGGFDRNLGREVGDTWEYRRATSATAASFGRGCGAPALTLSPVGAAPPVVGTTARVALTNVPHAAAFVALGWSNTAFGALSLPHSLAGLGMPGCDLLHSGELGVFAATPTGPGTARYDLALPYWPRLVGVTVYLQAWAPAPGANPAGMLVSGGVAWGVGER
jgi:hypothetical protein